MSYLDLVIITGAGISFVMGSALAAWASRWVAKTHILFAVWFTLMIGIGLVERALYGPEPTPLEVPPYIYYEYTSTAYYRTMEILVVLLGFSWPLFTFGTLISYATKASLNLVKE